MPSRTNGRCRIRDKIISYTQGCGKDILFSLEKFIVQHSNAFVLMKQCAYHIDFQIPNNHRYLNYLLDKIHSNDAPLQEAMYILRNDTGA